MNTTQTKRATVFVFVSVSAGDNVFNDITNAIKAGKMTQKALDDAVTRAFLTRFRLGEFDDARNPFFNKYPVELLDR